MNSAMELPYQGVEAILATMHGKERAIAPRLECELGLKVRVTTGLDTAQFGTFSREIERKGSQLDAARAKIAAAFAHTPQARLAVASEGSFGPHPNLPFLPLGREIVVLSDRTQELKIIGHDASSETNFAHAIVARTSEAMIFAERVGFPAHGVIVMGCEADLPAPHIVLFKYISYGAEIERAVQAAIDRCAMAWIEADMRADRNPKRMRAIGLATQDLIRRFQHRGPACARPDFGVTERIPGLPCDACGGPTVQCTTEVLTCRQCDHQVKRPATDRTSADPGPCNLCNP